MGLARNRKPRCYNFNPGLGMLCGPRNPAICVMPVAPPSSRRLIPESQLMFSAELARVVGLEGAVLVQQLKSVYQHQPATLRDGLGWLHVSHAYLLELMPFWDLDTLLAVCAHMEELGLLRIDRGSAASGCLLLALEETADLAAEPPAQTAPSPPQRAAGAATTDTGPTPTGSSSRAATAAKNRENRPAVPAEAGRGRGALRSGEGEPLPPDFVPSEDMLELLERFHGVPRNFALAQLEDFTLYWRERGSAGHAWQNRFKQHVQWHWKRHQQERAGASHGGEHEAGGTRRTRDSSLEHDLTDTSWAD
jgi:hypothetical protein